ncbi:MAG TPA: hypothetical protein VFE58_09075 [Tepidisphaeraceae bacterium]|jgi:hypothetical protein|nr:hypothetical protein [Tepidisphaeraceae bacterium]
MPSVSPGSNASNVNNPPASTSAAQTLQSLMESITDAFDKYAHGGAYAESSKSPQSLMDAIEVFTHGPDDFTPLHELAELFGERYPRIMDAVSRLQKLGTVVVSTFDELSGPQILHVSKVNSGVVGSDQAQSLRTAVATMAGSLTVAGTLAGDLVTEISPNPSEAWTSPDGVTLPPAGELSPAAGTVAKPILSGREQRALAATAVKTS